MKIKMIFVGKVQEGFLREGIGIYRDRISRYGQIEIIEVEEEQVSPGGDTGRAKKKEEERILKRVREDDLLIVLDEKGKEFTSEGMAGQLQKWMSSGVKGLAFAIGGSFGVGSGLKERADLVLSLSRMTLTHQMARLILLEQIYRGFTIVRGEPYHK